MTVNNPLSQTTSTSSSGESREETSHDMRSLALSSVNGNGNGNGIDEPIRSYEMQMLDKDNNNNNNNNHHHDDENHNQDDNDDMKMLLGIENDDLVRRRRNKLRMQQRKSSFLPSTIMQKRLITLRSSLLALSLTLTLLVFWLLDSLKDPTFAILVNGNLEKHQPLAKMASVGGTLFLVVMMEIVSNEREKQKRKKEEMDALRMSDDDVISGGGNWTKMDIGSGYQYSKNNNNARDDGGEDMGEDSGDRIPINIFKTVGLSYIVMFCSIAFILQYHHGFLGLEEGVQSNSAWFILGYFQYITIESFGSISVATFWSFANSTLTLKAAKMYYGFFIAMAQVGAIAGSTIATLPNISIPNLYFLACFGIGLQVLVMNIYGRRFPYSMDEDDDAAIVEDSDDCYETEMNVSVSAKLAKMRKPMRNSTVTSATATKNTNDAMPLKFFMSGVYLILEHNYLLLILGVSCLYEVSLTCLDYEMKLIGLDRFRAPPDFLEDNSVIDTTMNADAANAFTTFMGRYGQLTNILSLLLSYFAFPYLMENFGLKHTLRIFPTLLLAITTMAFIALPMNLPVLFISMSLLKALTYSINDPAKEILYIPTSNTVKFKAKFWIDVVGARAAKAIGSSINTYAGTIERIVQYGSLPSMATAVALWVVCYAAGVKFDSLLESGEIVGNDNDCLMKDLAFNNQIDEGEDQCCHQEDNYDDGVGCESQSDWESNASIEFETFTPNSSK